MILIDNFAQVAAQIETERGISKEEIQEAIELALVSACRKKFPESAILVAELDNNSGEVKIYQKKTAVKKVEDEAIELLTKEAKKLDPAAKLGTEIKIEVTPSNFGRIAAQTAKQVIIQRIREAEKNNIFEEFQKKIGQIIVGSVQRIENNNYLINLGRIEALLRYKDQIPEETYRAKDKIRVFISDIIKTPRGPMVQISRTHPNFLKKLMELEVPEITEGLIEIIKIAREPGKRAKIAVKSNHASISAVGTCVGPMGGRIQSVIRELHNEKIDVIEWDDNPATFIASSLKPAIIQQVVVTNEDEKEAIVVVKKDQLSLAIGKHGINIRLAVKLSGWKLEIIDAEEFADKKTEISSKTPISFADKIKKSKEEEKEAEAEEAAAEEAVAEEAQSD